uniref:Uncharacterized protein n=1 Tax=Timema douglasi TaxID=61478 RepID=A0A7R8VW87_TIMDO|nr:unnamed protein product [Timema douglasi]
MSQLLLHLLKILFIEKGTISIASSFIPLTYNWWNFIKS